MTSKTSKTLLFSTFAIVAIVGTFLFTNNISAEDHPEAIVMSLQPTNDDWLQKDGDRSVVEVKFENKDTLTVERGDRLVIPITLTHTANNEDVETIILRPSGTIGYVIPEPYSSQYSSQERADQLRDSGNIIGAVSLDQFVTYSDELVSIAPNTSEQIMMYIDIPTEIDANLLDTELSFQPAFYKIKADNLYMDNSIKDVIILSKGVN